MYFELCLFLMDIVNDQTRTLCQHLCDRSLWKKTVYLKETFSTENTSNYQFYLYVHTAMFIDCDTLEGGCQGLRGQTSWKVSNSLESVFVMSKLNPQIFMLTDVSCAILKTDIKSVHKLISVRNKRPHKHMSWIHSCLSLCVKQQQGKRYSYIPLQTAYIWKKERLLTKNVKIQ